jgi:HEAT repeat protein
MIDDLLALLSDPDKEVRSFAALQLKNRGDKAAIEPLIRSLTDPEPEVRASAVHSLSVLGSMSHQKKVVKHVEWALTDDDSAVRSAAAVGLGTWLLDNIDDISVIESLVNALMDADESVVDRAAFALERIYEKKGRYDLARPLLDAEGHPDERVRDKVEFILKKKIGLRPDANG